MSFGLRNAPQTSQRFVDEMLKGLTFAYGFLDDILIFSRNESEHILHLRQLFKRLTDYGMLVNTSKCEFGKSHITFLGHDISAAADSIRPSPDKVQAIQDYPIPKTVGEMRRFLGMFNFYRRFVPGATELQALLNIVLTGPNTKKSQSIVMTPEMTKAFNNCKASLSKATMLSHPEPDGDMAIFTDASDTDVAAKSGNLWHFLQDV
ncbi:unnamed protein product [Parnassius mnemosyne]|uniref:RNA-directed DNA polymerase n=1 Tax=Parnassius mnemosyne TaxID=213953 RepID=A0AAV1L1M2_9NEOP